MNAIEEIIAQWKGEATRLRTRYAAESLAALCEAHADELSEAWSQVEARSLTIREASELGGYSEAHLRRLIAQGVVANAGRKGAPRIRRADVPFKARMAGRSESMKERAAEAARRAGTRGGCGQAGR